MQATKIGNIQVYFIVHGNKRGIEMSNVFYVKEMDRNLISFAKVTDKNKVVSVGDTSKIYNEQNELIAIAWKENGLYKMRSYIDNKECNAITRSNEKMTLKEKYHRILGHVNFNYLDIMCKNKLVDGIPNDLESELLRCGTCIKNKMHNLAFENKRTRAKDLLEIVHTDLNGPHNTTGYNGEKYFLSFNDDYSVTS